MPFYGELSTTIEETSQYDFLILKIPQNQIANEFIKPYFPKNS